MSQNTTIETGYTGGYYREACNDGELGEIVAKYDIIAFCDTQEKFMG